MRRARGKKTIQRAEKRREVRLGGVVWVVVFDTIASSR